MEAQLELRSAVRAFPGVGPERAALLLKLGIETVEDLLGHIPRRYEDRTEVAPIGKVVEGEKSTVVGEVKAIGIKRFRHGRKCVVEMVLEDETGRLYCRWWNLPYMVNYFRAGQTVLAYGKVKSLRPRAMDHPDTEVLEEAGDLSVHVGRLVPIYPLTEGLGQRWLRALVWRVLSEVGPLPEHRPEMHAGGLPGRDQAIRQIHFPDSQPAAEQARRRLVFDELVELQWEIQSRRKRLISGARGRPLAEDNRLIRPFLKKLPFALTEAQARVLREIRLDMSRKVPMRRLLQGDVGAGKTVVGACAGLMAVENGCWTVLMAPTELLAEQHRQVLSGWLEPLGVPVGLWTGNRKDEELLEAGLAGFMVGTHALLEERFSLEKVGLTIIDEQHKFGVAQREHLVRKGFYPHLLVMTATPIPRTLGLTLYGDLDVSVLDELPAGRKGVRTFVREPHQLERVWEFVKSQLKEGRQAYVVLPRIAEDTERGRRAVLSEEGQLRARLEPFRVEILHGQLDRERKEAVMDGFRAGEVQVLVATQVIEVGVDVAKASVMVILDADVFGLAQLHQLRGRIGRGGDEGHCVLVASVKTKEAKARLKVLEQTQDGFRIAEEDMRLRGPGDLTGWQQSGLPPLRYGDLIRDRELVEWTRGEVRRVLAIADPA